VASTSSASSAHGYNWLQKHCNQADEARDHRISGVGDERSGVVSLLLYPCG
jgi:hypothetical protein